MRGVSSSTTIGCACPAAIESTIDLWLYFTPDLPPGLQLTEEAGALRRAPRATPLDDEYAHRALALWRALPCPRATRLLAPTFSSWRQTARLLTAARVEA